MSNPSIRRLSVYHTSTLEEAVQFANDIIADRGYDPSRVDLQANVKYSYPSKHLISVDFVWREDVYRPLLVEQQELTDIVAIPDLVNGKDFDQVRQDLESFIHSIQVKLDEDVRYMNTEKVVFDRFDGFCDCCGYSGQTAIRFMRLETDNEIKKRVGKNE